MKKIMVREVISDNPYLFGDLDDVINYLSDIRGKHPDKKIYLTDVWDGYEDVHYEICFTRKETDEEFKTRKQELARKKAQEAAEAKKAIERREKEEQFQKLKRELGYW